VSYWFWEDWTSDSLVVVHVAGCEYDSHCERLGAADLPAKVEGVSYGPFDSLESVYDTVYDVTDPLDAWWPAECIHCRPGAVAVRLS
jgi:hypothetical protein